MHRAGGSTHLKGPTMTEKTFQRRILRRSIGRGPAWLGNVRLHLECSHTKLVTYRSLPSLLGYTHCAVCERNEDQVRK